MICLIRCCCLLLCIKSAICQAEGQSLPAAMQGTWLVESLTDNGRALEVSERDKFEFVKDKLRITEPREGMTFEFSVRLGDTEMPKFFDISMGGISALGIYEFRDGKLIICFAQPGKERPSEFKSLRGDNRRLVILRRSQD